MYYFEGLPESLYKLSIQLNEKWKFQGRGEIRLINYCKYHGKLYCFYKNNQCFSAIIGSANLSFFPKHDTTQNTQQQYEIAFLTNNSKVLENMSKHIDSLKMEKISKNLSDIPIRELKLIKDDENIKVWNDDKLLSENVSEIKRVNETELKKIINLALSSKITFTLPLKVPYAKERFNNSRRSYTKSNLNVCYGTPRGGNELEKNWYETQITVNKKIVTKKNYPRTKRKDWFYVITDDGYQFKAHTTSQNNKQFSAVGDERLLGRWIKGRLVKAGLVQPVKNVTLDAKRTGMITKEILIEYGCEALTLINTGEKKLDENENLRDVWFLSFPRKDL